MVLEAGYPNTTGFRKVTKATILVKKKDGISDQAFVEHYTRHHAAMAAEVLLKHKIITYSLTFHLKHDRTVTQDIMKGKAQLLDYDAICTFVFPDYLSFAKFMYDREGHALSSDHDNFMDESQMKMMVGDEYMVIDDGKKVEKPDAGAA
ncbi:hypothetical protein DIS24_g1314 [Lasiodiplodia hormozganensis]|uniref:EthD domain-containing protein n=1 Tax=Lasiodiplodia hormozganensis TaxID=869390 RepID=A0AA40D632_9PEZI|nr:hypothetical protein DIS24_g1314 [Lasiodiplodia hormozganensis]